MCGPGAPRNLTPQIVWPTGESQTKLSEDNWGLTVKGEGGWDMERGAEKLIEDKGNEPSTGKDQRYSEHELGEDGKEKVEGY